MGFPEDISPHGHLVDEVFWLATKLTGVAFALVVVVLVYCMIRYRARQGHKAWYTHGNTPGAIALTLLLAVVVFFGIDVNLAIADHRAYEKVWGDPPARADALVVQCLPEQFQWNFRYAGADGKWGTKDDLTTIGDLRVPVNQWVIVELRSKDVIHSFFLPNLRIKQDCLPGMTTMVYFKAQKTGKYEIACAELCGLGHTKMRGFLTVEEPPKHEMWRKERFEEFEPELEKWKQWDLATAAPVAEVRAR